MKRLDRWISDENDVFTVNDVSLTARMKRGWYWGSEIFREKMLDRLDGKKSEKTRNYRGSRMRKDRSERRAKQIIKEAEEHYQMKQSDLKKMRRGDWMRSSIAWAIAKETTVGHSWIAKELGLKSAANSSQQIRRFNTIEKKELPALVKQWKQSINVA